MGFKRVLFVLREAFNSAQLLSLLKKAGIESGDRVLEVLKSLDPVFVNKKKLFYTPALVNWVISKELDVNSGEQVKRIGSLLKSWAEKVSSLRGLGKYQKWEKFYEDFKTLKSFEEFSSSYFKQDSSSGDVSSVRDMVERAGGRFLEERDGYKYYFVDDIKVMKYLGSSLSKFCIKDNIPFYEEYGGLFIFIVKDQKFAGDFAIKHFSFWTPENKEVFLKDMEQFQKRAVELGIREAPNVFSSIPLTKKVDYIKIYVSLGLPVKSMSMKSVISKSVSLKALYKEVYGEDL